MTPACEGGNSKLVEVVTVVDVDDGKQIITDLVALLRFRSKSSGKILKLLGSGPECATELKGGDRTEGGAERGLPQGSYSGKAAGFWGTYLLGFKDLHAVI